MGTYHRMDLTPAREPERRSHLVTCMYRASVPLKMRERLEAYVTTMTNSRWAFTEEWIWQSDGSFSGQKTALRQLELSFTDNNDHIAEPVLGLKVRYGPVHGNSPSDVKRLLRNAGITEYYVARIGAKEHALEGCRHPACAIASPESSSSA